MFVFLIIVLIQQASACAFNDGHALARSGRRWFSWLQWPKWPTLPKFPFFWSNVSMPVKLPTMPTLPKLADWVPNWQMPKMPEWIKSPRLPNIPDSVKWLFWPDWLKWPELPPRFRPNFYLPRLPDWVTLPRWPLWGDPGDDFYYQWPTSPRPYLSDENEEKNSWVSLKCSILYSVRPKKRWMDCVKDDMGKKGVSEMTNDRGRWKITYCADLHGMEDKSWICNSIKMSTDGMPELWRSKHPPRYAAGHNSETTTLSTRRTTTPTTTTTTTVRTTSTLIPLQDDCDYLVFNCLKAYRTGRVCGRTLYYNYHSFENYCMLDYVNCMERYEIWQIVHMGDCFKLQMINEYQHYEYLDDYFLDQTYVVQE